jgi:DNA-binding response OmpR family regulator
LLDEFQGVPRIATDSQKATILLLLVEDEPLVLDLMESELTDAGFDVLAAGDGARALAELNTDAARFRAVITDIRLGAGPDGWEVGRRARELIHEMPIVYVSGDSGHNWASKGVPNSVMILKPFAPAQLITAVSMLVNRADTQGSGRAVE